METAVATQDTQFTLPLDPNEVNLDQLKAVMGVQDEVEAGSNLPRLSINYSAEYVDEDAAEEAKADGKKYKPVSLPLGQYKVQVQPGRTEDGEPTGPYVNVFAEDALFRPIINGNRYQIYNNDDEKMVLNTEIFRSWQQVIVDDRGGEQSARSYKKKMVTKYDHLIGEPRDLKCKNVLFGLLTLIDGKDMDGNDVEVKDMPCEWYSHGASFMPVSDAISDIKKRGILPCARSMKLATGREKSGSVTYYPVEVEWDTDEHELDTETLQLTKDFSDLIDAENAEIRAKYTAKHAKSEADSIAQTIETSSLSDDLDEDIPF